MKIVEGIAQEIVDRSLKCGAGVGHSRVQEEPGLQLGSTAGLEPEATRIMLYDMVAGGWGAQVLLHITAHSAQTLADRHVVVIESKAGREAIIAKQIVDCTGDGDVARLVGRVARKLHRRTLLVHFAHLATMGGTWRLEELLPWMETNGTVNQIVIGRKIGGTEDEIIRLTMTLA